MGASPTYQLFIDGQWVASDGGEALDVVNPATEEVIGTVPQGTSSDVVRAICSARRAFDEGPWPQTSPRERSKVLSRMADVMERRRDELIELNVREAGSVRALAETLQVGIPIAHFRDTAERVLLGYPFEQGMLPTTAQGVGQGVVLREPAGVAGLITAYNFPLFLNLFKAAASLAAGCTAVLKPAPATPLEAFVLAEIAEEAGLPPGVLNVVTGDIEAGQQLTTHPMVDVISFTGSDAVGRMVAAQASSTLKKVVLELGGKSANIICDDADLSKVLPSVLQNMLIHAGQGCALLTRTLVHRSLHDELIGMAKDALSQVNVGDPADPTVMMGPLISEAQRQKVEGLIATGLAEGAQIAFGGGRPHALNRGFFVEPTLLTGVDNAMAVAQKEFFGPVGVVIPFDDDDEAVRLANASKYGLAGGVWANNPARAYGIAKRLRAGHISVNGGDGGISPHGPFGGYKQSGLGREWGAFGLEEFLESKTVVWPVASG
jgi:aldehyde dehydrogenase (NAD+)